LLEGNDLHHNKKIIFYLAHCRNQMSATIQQPFRVEESLALLRTIFPNYPDLKDAKAVPDLDHFLEAYRSESFEAA
jgi:hypothetical protein